MLLARELWLAARLLARAPGFALVATLTLGLTIGACTAIYSVVYGVALQPLPYPNPDRLVHLWQLGDTGEQSQFSDPNFEDVHAGSARQPAVLATALRRPQRARDCDATRSGRDARCGWRATAALRFSRGCRHLAAARGHGAQPVPHRSQLAGRRTAARRDGSRCCPSRVDDDRAAPEAGAWRLDVHERQVDRLRQVA
ncbi:MAG: hypothetical protein GEU99_10165 [Luteitalea sp.]|nr:hypothetical protein [Luteitalea sp.]